MPSHLSPNAYLAAIGADIVVLDTCNNAYFCLPDAAGAVQVVGRTVTISDAALAEEFEGAGFLASSPSAPHDATSPRPTRDLGMRTAERVSANDLAVILGAWLSMFTHYHGRSFDSLLKVARKGRNGGGIDKPIDGAIKLVAAFERVLPWLPFQGVCLYRAFLLLQVLRKRGYDARWVFGVRTWPFLAHCWLQVGETALDDTADRLVAFEPILVV